MAQQSKLTPAAREAILNGLRAGMTRSAAAGVAGVHRSQMTRWCERYATFATDCDIAEQQAEARFVAVVTRAAQSGDPKIALEWLKRRRREDWGDSQKTELTGPDAGPLRIRVEYSDSDGTEPDHPAAPAP